ncbi:MAG: 3D domain-containing protein [Kiritimatiellia bacterium]|jgi:3D (Asp-Asp-Asp) domain-containing protein
MKKAKRRAQAKPPPISSPGRFEIGRLLAVGMLLAAIPLFMMMEGCRVVSVRPPSGTRPGTTVFMEVTGYDNGPKSCGWERDWLGRPVYGYGPMKGKRKQVGITASGTRAKHGTVAADTRYYPFGTILYIPGYGYGRVEDRGGDIKGPTRLDVWFPNEKAALKWGRRKNVRVTVWKKP